MQPMKEISEPQQTFLSGLEEKVIMNFRKLELEKSTNIGMVRQDQAVVSKVTMLFNLIIIAYA